MRTAASISAPLADPAIRRLWDDCLARARAASEPTVTTEDGTVFQSNAHLPYLDLPYLDAIDAASQGSIRLNVYDERATSVAAEYTFRRGPLRITAPPPLTPVSAILPSDASAVRQMCIDQARRASAVRITLPPGSVGSVSDPEVPEVPEVPNGADWTQTRFVTYMLRLASRDDMLGAWTKNRRRTLAKHAGAFELSEENDAHDVIARFVAESYSRHGRRPPIPEASLSRLARLCCESGLCRIYVLRTHEGTPSAAVAVLLGNRVASYWMAGSVPGPAMTVLLAELLVSLHADGYVAFDFVGANTPSIAEFKRRFGGALLPYHSLLWRGKSARALDFASSLIRRTGSSRG